MTGVVAGPDPTAGRNPPPPHQPAPAPPGGYRCIQFVASHDDGREWRNAYHDRAGVLAAIRRHLDRPGMYSICIWFWDGPPGSPADQ